MLELTPLSRRRCLATLPAATFAVAAIAPGVLARAGGQPTTGGPASPDKAAAPGNATPADSALDSFPSQGTAKAREVVGASHGNIERVTALLKEMPRLANAAYDWGFGDWETPLGAAAHTGRRAIAELLLEHGARIDVFAMAMLGKLDAVQAMIQVQPGLQRVRGPHGINLMRHAQAGGEQAVAVVKYLQTLGEADIEYQDLPLTDAQRDTCLGTYSYGQREDQRFRVFVPEKATRLSIQRGVGNAASAPRTLFHQGELTFHPAGAPEVRIAFSIVKEQAQSVTITSPSPVLSATRV